MEQNDRLEKSKDFFQKKQLLNQRIAKQEKITYKISDKE